MKLNYFHILYLRGERTNASNLNFNSTPRETRRARFLISDHFLSPLSVLILSPLAHIREINFVIQYHKSTYVLQFASCKMSEMDGELV